MSDCPRCGGTGEVYSQVERRVVETYDHMTTAGIWERREVVKKYGGIDACPLCAEKAETEWNTWR